MGLFRNICQLLIYQLRLNIDFWILFINTA